MTTQATNSFLPEGYKTPDSGGNYMKFDQGDNEFRILSKTLVGWEYWNLENKPVRIEGVAKPAVDPALIKVDAQGNQHLKHFWAFVVYNYKAKAIQILQINQNKIQKDLESYIVNPKWGNPFLYDFNVKKSGEKLQTKYQIIATPPAPVTDEVKAAYKEKSPINLKALLTGGDPFAGVKPAVAAATVAPPTPAVTAPSSEATHEDELPF